MPLYGRAFTNTTGIGQSFQGVGQGSWEAGVWDYKDLPHAGAQVHYDQESGATYSYDGNSKTLVSYDTLDMAKTKVQYIKKKGLGGAMWWELSGDRQDGGSIVTNVRVLLVLLHLKKGLLFHVRRLPQERLWPCRRRLLLTNRSLHRGSEG